LLARALDAKEKIVYKRKTAEKYSTPAVNITHYIVSEILKRNNVEYKFWKNIP
jgi:hypothetical protein